MSERKPFYSNLHFPYPLTLLLLSHILPIVLSSLNTSVSQLVLISQDVLMQFLTLDIMSFDFMHEDKCGTAGATNSKNKALFGLLLQH